MRGRIPIALLTLGLVTAACGGGPATSPDAAGSASSPTATDRSDPPAASTAPTGVPEILDFEAPLLGGGTLRGADYAGQDVAFWFWAPW